MSNEVINVLVFARIAEVVGSDRVTLAATTAAELKAAIADAYPELETLVPSLLVAVNGQYVRDDFASLGRDAEVAVFPPVSGG